MFCALWRDPTDCLPDLPPAGALISGRQGRLVTQAISRTSQEIGESKEGKRILAPFGGSGCDVASAPLHEGLDKLRRVGRLAGRLPPSASDFNYVLTTMC
jgi:hypothetical protein